jgi:hypothetical protein
MKTLILSLTVFVCVCTDFIAGFCQAPKNGSVKVKMIVIDSVKNRINDPLIAVFENSKEIVKESKKNPCSFILDLNKVYIIEVSNVRYGKKYLLFDTSVPPIVKNYFNFHYTCKVILNGQNSSMDKPAVKIYYTNKDFNFIQLN